MKESAETKICPLCAEVIKAAAKKCPSCNSRLVRYALFREEFSVGFACLIVFATFILVCAWVLPNDSDGGRYQFARHRKDLETKGVSIVIGSQGSSGHYYDVSGVITNQGSHAWRVRELELTITNAQGAPDVVHANVETPFVVQPGTDHAFVFHKRTSLTNSVVAVRARVENATDGNARNTDY